MLERLHLERLGAPEEEGDCAGSGRSGGWGKVERERAPERKCGRRAQLLACPRGLSDHQQCKMIIKWGWVRVEASPFICSDTNKLACYALRHAVNVYLGRHNTFTYVDTTHLHTHTRELAHTPKLLTQHL